MFNIIKNGINIRSNKGFNCSNITIHRLVNLLNISIVLFDYSFNPCIHIRFNLLNITFKICLDNINQIIAILFNIKSYGIDNIFYILANRNITTLNRITHLCLKINNRLTQIFFNQEMGHRSGFIINFIQKTS